MVLIRLRMPQEAERTLLYTHNGGETFAPGKSCIDFHSHRECMEEDYEYANELEKQGGKKPKNNTKILYISQAF